MARSGCGRSEASVTLSVVLISSRCLWGAADKCSSSETKALNFFLWTSEFWVSTNLHHKVFKSINSMQTTNAKTFCIIQTLKAYNNCIIDIYLLPYNFQTKHPTTTACQQPDWPEWCNGKVISNNVRLSPSGRYTQQYIKNQEHTR